MIFSKIHYITLWYNVKIVSNQNDLFVYGYIPINSKIDDDKSIIDFINQFRLYLLPLLFEWDITYTTQQFCNDW